MENTVPQWTFKLHSTSTTEEKWLLKGHTLRVNQMQLLMTDMEE
jgi:hypothetical protein